MSFYFLAPPLLFLNILQKGAKRVWFAANRGQQEGRTFNRFDEMQRERRELNTVNSFPRINSRCTISKVYKWRYLNVSLSYRAHTIRVTEQTTVSNKLISFYQKRFSETFIVSTVRRNSNGKYIFEFREFFVWL